MQLRNRIYAYVLLGLYLGVVLHGGAKKYEDVDVEKSILTHQHDDYGAIHHEHEFHVGIFHFLGHLLQNIDLSDIEADKHLVVVQETSTKKSIESNKSIKLWHVDNLIDLQEGLESQSDPPENVPVLLQRLKQPNTPLRGPPSFV